MEGPTLEQGNVPEGDPRGKPMLGQAPGGICGPMERGAHAGAGLLAGLVTSQGPTLEQSAPEGLEGTHDGALQEELHLTGGAHVEEVCGKLSCMVGTPCWSRGRAR